LNEVLKAYKYRIYPTPEQEELLAQTFGCARFVWNKLVENFNAYGTDSYDPKFSEATIKRSNEFSWLADVSAASLQQKRIDFNETKRQFFNKKRKKALGRPSFKRRSGRQSYRLPNQKFRLDQEKGLVRLEKIGYVPIVLDRKLPEDVDYHSITISKTPSGKYFASILVKINVDLKPLTGKRVGIDLGLKDLFILSDGQSISNPKWFRESQAKLRAAQKHLSRKTKGSKRYEKQRIKTARIHEHTANQRKDFLHNFSTSLVTHYDVICIEDLNVAGMVKNRCLAKAISDAGWATFTSMLDYKCKWYGKSLVKVDRWFASSKTCSACGEKLDALELSKRAWECPACGEVHDRDLNAAYNILNKGFSDLTGQEIVYKSAESVDNRRGEEVSLFGAKHHLASSVKRLDKFIDLL